ncbi:MAG TPA: FlgD immunoglobulin-like domain containing protein, partial [Actinomycetes bacterium]|nr:FlgD immunoglobulin-like domain containing protein [Actinomycetes bacterium]
MKLPHASFPPSDRPSDRQRNGRYGATRLRAGVLAGVVVAALLGGHAAASASEVQRGGGTTPVITAPADSTVVPVSPVHVSATSTATIVRFVLDSRGGVFTVDANVVAGSAAADLPTAGIDGSTDIRAYDCTAPDVCNTAFDSVAVTIKLADPKLTKPPNDELVGGSFKAAADADQGAIAFQVDGQTRATDTTSPFAKTVGIAGLADGKHSVRAVQCDATGTVCEGPISNVRKIVKDTKPPRWSDVGASPDPLYPFRDHYKDSTKLSAKVSENVVNVRVEIHRKDGPLVRTLRLGSKRAGKVNVSWNGRTAGGDMVRPGAYTFRFIGSDAIGHTSKSTERTVQVSDKRLVRQSGSKTLSAKGSFVGSISGSCG